MLLEYSKLITDDRRTQYQANALMKLKESLAAHKTFDSLKSREQYYEFISALYKASCVVDVLGDQNTRRNMGFDLKSISMTLFCHYCRNQTLIVHDDNSKTHINAAVKFLGLPSYDEINSYIFGTTTMSVGWSMAEVAAGAVNAETGIDGVF